MEYRGGTRAALLRLCGLPPMRASADEKQPRHGRIERAILARLRAFVGHGLMTDELPAEILGFDGERKWNARAGRYGIMRYPGVGPKALAAARASISRAIRQLKREGLIVQAGRNIRPAGTRPLSPSGQSRSAARPGTIDGPSRPGPARSACPGGFAGGQGTLRP
jgi:hypothetical protein